MEGAEVRALVRCVGEERGWPADWLNDGVKGFLSKVSLGRVVLSAPGITVRCTSVEHLLALKLSAWRDDLDIADAVRLLTEFGTALNREQTWEILEEYLVSGAELKAWYGFQDIWEAVHGRPQ